MHSRDARCTSDQRSVQQRSRFPSRKARRPILVALAIAALTLPSVGDAFAQFSTGFGGFGGGGFGRGGGIGGGMGRGGMMPRGGGGMGAGNAMQVRPNLARPQIKPHIERVKTTRTTRIAKSKGEGTARLTKGCRRGDCKPPKDTGRKPPRHPDGPGDVARIPPKHRLPHIPPSRIVIPVWQVRCRDAATRYRHASR